MEKILSSESYINIYSLSLVATLRYLGKREVAIGRNSLFTIYFVFRKTREILEIIEGFESGHLIVEPYTFFLCLKETEKKTNDYE